MNWNDKPKYRKNYYNQATETENREPRINQASGTENREPRIDKHRESNFRGKLSPLMCDSEKQSAKIQPLVYDFASRIIRLYQYLNEDANYREYTLSKQVLRSGTSIGANVREAQHAQSDADFLSKMSIAHKEADETSYWLHLLHDNGYLNDSSFESINTDCDRINRMLNSITLSTKKTIQSKKNR